MNTPTFPSARQTAVLPREGRRVQLGSETKRSTPNAEQARSSASPGGSSAANTPPRRTALRLIWVAATLALVGFCGFMGLRDVGRTTLPIEQMQVMRNRVLADNPEIDGPASGQFGAIDPPNWRLVDLRMQKPDGGRMDITLGRPAWWLEQVAARPGASIHLDLAELDLVGEARVLAVRPSPTPKAGHGRVVTGKFVHYAGNVLEVSIEGLDEPLRVTANHLFWSADREEFIHAEGLVPGETLRSHDGQTLHVLANVPLHGVHRVYNVEVDGEHVYCVGSGGVLVHNMCPVPPFSANERAIAVYLENLGRKVRRNPLEGLAGAGRQGDALVDGVLHEFETLAPGATSSTIRNVVNNSIRRGGQARNLVIDARGTGLAKNEALRGIRRALDISRGKIDYVAVIGTDFFVGAGP